MPSLTSAVLGPARDSSGKLRTVSALIDLRGRIYWEPLMTGTTLKSYHNSSSRQRRNADGSSTRQLQNAVSRTKSLMGMEQRYKETRQFALSRSSPGSATLRSRTSIDQLTEDKMPPKPRLRPPQTKTYVSLSQKNVYCSPILGDDPRRLPAALAAGAEGQVNPPFRLG